MCSHEKLQWTQRIALVRHNLHIASSTGDFTFFKTLQADRFRDDCDHVASLRSALGDDADPVIASLDKSNAVIGFVHEDSFKKIFDLARRIADARRPSSINASSGSGVITDEARIAFHYSIVEQRRVADSAIDKMVQSAIACISQLPPAAQMDAAHVFVTGTTFVADAMQICLQKMTALDASIGTFHQDESALAAVQLVVGAAVSALKGVFTLMSDGHATAGGMGGEAEESRKPLRSSSIDVIARNLLKRMSMSASTTSLSSSFSPSASRRPSMSSPVAANGQTIFSTTTRLSHKRAGSSASGAVSKMPTIPPTPAHHLTNPFDVACEYVLQSLHDNASLTQSRNERFPFGPTQSVGEMADDLKDRSPSIASVSTAGTGIDPMSFSRNRSAESIASADTSSSSPPVHDVDVVEGDAYAGFTGSVPQPQPQPLAADSHRIEGRDMALEAATVKSVSNASSSTIQDAGPAVNAHAVQLNSAAAASVGAPRKPRAGSKGSAGSSFNGSFHSEALGSVDETPERRASERAGSPSRPNIFKRLSSMLSTGGGKD